MGLPNYTVTIMKNRRENYDENQLINGQILHYTQYTQYYTYRFKKRTLKKYFRYRITKWQWTLLGEYIVF